MKPRLLFGMHGSSHIASAFSGRSSTSDVGNRPTPGQSVPEPRTPWIHSLSMRCWIPPTLSVALLAVSAAVSSCTHGRAAHDAAAVASLNDELELGRQVNALARQAKVVGVGEATHGSGTVIEQRGRLTLLLVDRMGFDVVALEAPAERCELLARYVAGEDVDPRAALKETFYWCWQNEEMLAAIKLLREWNARQATMGSTRRVRFTGMDVFPGGASRSRALRILAQYAPDAAAHVQELADQIMSLSTDERNLQNDRRRVLLAALQKAHEGLAARLASAGTPAASAAEAEESLGNFTAFLDYATSGPIPLWAVRDTGMFRNVVRLAEQADRGVIVWAHNGHIENSPNALGGMLRKHYRDSYLAVGSVIGRGQTLALDPTSQRVVVHELGLAAGQSGEAWLLESTPGGALIDIRDTATDPLTVVLRAPNTARMDVGFYVPPDDARFGTYNYGSRFDALYFVPVSAPSRPIRTWPEGVPMHDG